MENARLGLVACLIICYMPGVDAQTSVPGQVTTAVSTSFQSILDPNGDGYITKSGGAFTNGFNEIDEFEVHPFSIGGWQELANIDETQSDVNPNCSNVDLIPDDDGGGYGYFTVIDSTPALPQSGDEYLIIRFRTANTLSSGNFAYNILLDTDEKYGTGIDPNATCGNQGFEREVIFSTGGSTAGVSVYDVDGSITHVGTTCNKCILKADVQEAKASGTGGCAKGSSTFVSVPVPLSYLGMPSTRARSPLYVTMASSASGNGTTILGGGNTKDYGGINSSGTACGCSTGTSCEIFDCQTNCINSAFVATLPVTMTYFNAEVTPRDVRVRWGTSSEVDSRYFEVEHSRDGVRFAAIGRVYSRGGRARRTDYEYLHAAPAAGTHYYRLRQVDHDGASVTGNMKAVRYGRHAGTDFAVVPTLLQGGELRLQRFGAAWSDRAEVSIVDVMGRMVVPALQFVGTALSVDVSHLRPGGYVVRLQEDGKLAARRFVKQ